MPPLPPSASLPPASPSPSPTPSAPPSPPVRVYLTFDDGPIKDLSDKILDTLDQYGVKATFFLLGENLGGNEDAVRRMVGSGHAIGLHSYTHKKNVFYKSPENMLAELKRENDQLELITMQRTRLVRTPYGSWPNMNKELCQAMTEGGYRFWDWNIDPGDAYAGATAAKVSSKVIADLQAFRSSKPPIILLHEREATLAALPAILDFMTSKDYIFVVFNPSDPPINQMKYVD